MTSATWGRVRQNLEPLCWRWRGPISVAMMLRVPVGRSDDDVARRCDRARQLALAGGCTDVIIEAQTSPAESMFTRQFPVNLLILPRPRSCLRRLWRPRRRRWTRPDEGRTNFLLFGPCTEIHSPFGDDLDNIRFVTN